MRPARILVSLAVGSVVALGFSTAAQAATGTVDGSLTVAGSTCSWTGATTSDVPPNTLTVDHTTVSPSCDGSISASLTNDPTVTFDDTAGTASSAEIDVSATVAGINCNYSVTNLTVTRQDSSSRTYTGGPFTANKTSGGLLCPGSETVDSASLTFH
jgi:predicted alpha/beta hydrolase family esterase